MRQNHRLGGQGLCKHEDIVLTRFLVLQRVFKVASNQGERRGRLGFVSLKQPQGYQGSICCDRSLSDGRMGREENKSVALEQLDASLQ